MRQSAQETRMRPFSTLLAFVGLFLSISLLSGCQFRRFSMAMNQEHAVPYPEMTVLPLQSEPPID